MLTVTSNARHSQAIWKGKMVANKAVIETSRMMS